MSDILIKITSNLSESNSETENQENKIIQGIKSNLKFPECFDKSFSSNKSKIIATITKIIVKNHIYTTALDFNQHEQLISDYKNKINIMILSKKYKLAPLYLLNIIFKKKYSHSILHINKNKNILDNYDFNSFKIAKSHDDYTLESNTNKYINKDELEYKEYIKHFLHKLKIKFIVFEFWFEVSNSTQYKWISFSNDYGACLEKKYPNEFDKNINFLTNNYGPGIIFYSNNFCENLNSNSSSNSNSNKNIYLPVDKNIVDLKNIINPDTTKQGDFYKFAIESKTDKVTHHNYYKYYPLFLEKYRELIKSKTKYTNAMIEIGINHYRSLKLWEKYFPTAYIYGLDIGFKDKKSNYEVFQCDQSNLDELTKVSDKIIEENKQVFFIIDDGSHHPDHQIMTFDLFFDKLLCYGGCYIIEDIETSYWSKNDIYGYKTNFGYLNKNSAIEQTKNLIDDINGEFMNLENKNIQDGIIGNTISKSTRNLISNIFFGQNNIIILKKTLDDLDINKREYRFGENL